mmetsp:Transcript_30807/g.80872  ORF Transcript_30807/g.80872 Transcript_30807/m.80872 type:complete len:331 (-) Transcript_30807:181-1173(-)
MSRLGPEPHEVPARARGGPDRPVVQETGDLLPKQGVLRDPALVQKPVVEHEALDRRGQLPQVVGRHWPAARCRLGALPRALEHADEQALHKIIPPDGVAAAGRVAPAALHLPDEPHRVVAQEGRGLRRGVARRSRDDVAQDEADAAVPVQVLGADAVGHAVGGVAVQEQDGAPGQLLHVGRRRRSLGVEGRPEDEARRLEEGHGHYRPGEQPRRVDVRHDGAPGAVVVHHHGVHPAGLHDAGVLQGLHQEPVHPLRDVGHGPRRAQLLLPPHASTVGVAVAEEVLRAERRHVHRVLAPQLAVAALRARVLYPGLDLGAGRRAVEAWKEGQ